MGRWLNNKTRNVHKTRGICKRLNKNPIISVNIMDLVTSHSIPAMSASPSLGSTADFSIPEVNITSIGGWWAINAL